MSDPVTNVEIEDVLESIRRLVAAGDPAGSVPPKRAQPRQDRLVLTPAFRVDCSDTLGDDAREAEDPTPVMPPVDDTSDAHDATPGEWEAVGDEPEQDTPPSDAIDDSGAADEVDRLLAQAMATTLPLTAQTLHSSERLEAESQVMADPVLEWEDLDTATRGHVDRPEADHDTPDDAQTDMNLEDPPFDTARSEEADATTLWHSSRSIPHEEAETTPETDPAEAEPQPRDQAARRSDLEATIAELEAAVTFSAQDFEPDDPEMGIDYPSSGRLHLVITGELDPQETAGEETAAAPPDEEPETADDAPSDTPSQAGTAPRFRVFPGSAPPRDAGPAPGPQDNHIAARPDLDDDADLAAYLEDESVIDEEALRDLVGQIVREELQGVLGERITRNVRKLVRREIHRILSSQDFD